MNLNERLIDAAARGLALDDDAFLFVLRALEGRDPNTGDPVDSMGAAS